MRRLLIAAAVLALPACEAADTDDGPGDLADGGEVLEATGICEGDAEPAAEGMWRCPTGEPNAYYVLLEPGEEDLEVLTMLFLQDGAGGQLVVGEEPEPWLLDVQDPAVADEVADRTGGTVIDDEA